MADKPPAMAGRRILIVEDEYLIATELERWLNEAGAVVIGPVPSVEEALHAISEEGPLDAAVLDITLALVNPRTRSQTDWPRSAFHSCSRLEMYGSATDRTTSAALASTSRSWSANS